MDEGTEVLVQQRALGGEGTMEKKYGTRGQDGPEWPHLLPERDGVRLRGSSGPHQSNVLLTPRA